MERLKLCKRCLKEHPMDTEHFYRQASRNDGFHPWCKSCAKEHQKNTKNSRNKRVRERWEENEEWRSKRLDVARNWRKDNKEWKRDYERKRYKKHTEEYRKRDKVFKEKHQEEYKIMARARASVYHAIKKGLFSRPAICSWCNKEHPNIEAAHHDYNLPLDIVWLCKVCHSQWDYEYPKIHNENCKFDVMDYFYGEETHKDAL